MMISSVLQSLLGQNVTGQFVRYLLAGVLNTIVGYGTFWIANQWFGMHISLSNTLAYATSLGVAYLLNRFFVFSGHEPMKGSVLVFLACFGVAFVVNQIVLLSMAAITALHPGIIQLFAMASYTIVFFVLNKTVVFSNKSPASARPDRR